jgi:hypothetical protein
MPVLLALLLTLPSLACDVLGYQGAQLVQVGSVVASEVRAMNGTVAGRLVGGLIQRFSNGNFAVVGRFTGSTVYALGSGNQFVEVGKIDGDRILALTGNNSYTQAGAAVSCLNQQAAAGALLLVLRPSN